MPSKRPTPEQIIGKLRETEIVLAQGGTTAEACRRIAVSVQTYYRWQGVRRKRCFAPTLRWRVSALSFRALT